MIGDTLARFLVLVAGFVWPAYQSFKSLSQKNAEETRSWCIYWVVLAIFTFLERVALDRLLFWVPFYYEVKVALVVYLWHPKTAGAVYLYSHLLEPFLSKHEAIIDKTLKDGQTHVVDFVQKHSKTVVSLVQSKAQVAVGHLQKLQEKAK
eukprot:jgi/Botrbrau1/5766/Bobra.0134s0034.1